MPQARITVHSPGDICEQEADTIASQITQAPMASEPVAPKPVPSAGALPSAAGAPLPRVLGVASSGEVLSAALRAHFEHRLLADFSDVRIHAGADAERSVRALDSRAYTTGSHIVFGSGQFCPESAEGRSLLAHELTHVLQQRGQPSSPMQRDALPTIPKESVAERIAEVEKGNYQGDLPVLRLLAALEKAVKGRKKEKVKAALEAFLAAAAQNPLEYASQSLIGHVGDELAANVFVIGLHDEADRLLAHFHSAASDYVSPGIRGTLTSYIAIGSGYFPSSSRVEGGFADRKGRPLHTLQDFKAKRAPYVSVAMDADAVPYGTQLTIDELPGVVFRVVDTGDAFVGKGYSRIDICTADARASVDPTINGPLHLHFAIPLPDNDLPVSY